MYLFQKKMMILTVPPRRSHQHRLLYLRCRCRQLYLAGEEIYRKQGVELVLIHQKHNAAIFWFSDGGSNVIVLVAMALLLACFILGAAVWYWWNQIRNSDGHHRQVTMVNMKTKSERGEGK